MKNYKLFSVSLAIVAGLALPLWAQRGGRGGGGGGLGAGQTAGRVTGAASETSSATMSQRGQGRAVGESMSSAASVTDNPMLSSRVQTLLPGGETVSTAAAGFQNQGQFLAAVHVAHNLNIPFDQLKAQMTGSSQVSLGKAIKNLMPNLSGKEIKQNVKLADQQSARDITQSSSSGKQDRVATGIASDSKLSARLTTMLPQGMTLPQAAAGFKNQGQFIAALEVSKNLGIPFVDLKDRISAGESLGAAIHGLKPAMSTSDVQSSVETAEEQSKNIQAQASMNTSANVKTSPGTK